MKHLISLLYVQDRVSCTGWNGGRGVIGIQDASGTVAHWPPDRNTGRCGKLTMKREIYKTESKC
ncbi:MAG: hypothetical protein IPP30_14405 [Flavobacterium sp.]|nr:hypothetical protein [Flavobacterium sp.]